MRTSGGWPATLWCHGDGLNSEEGLGAAPPAPLIFHLGQFLDDLEDHVWTEKQWLLAYAHMLQHTAEAHDSCCWLNQPPWLSIQLAAVAEAFMDETGVDHLEAKVTNCWRVPPFPLPCQCEGLEWAWVSRLINKLACWRPNKGTFDELAYPPLPPADECEDFKFICSHLLDMANSMPRMAIDFCTEDGSFVCWA